METSQSKSLSPAAQAVLDAVCDNTEPDCDTQHLIAAALRAVADQVVPEEEAMPLNLALRLRWDARQHVRHEILAIAAELEGSVTYNPPEDNEMEETQWTMLVN